MRVCSYARVSTDLTAQDESLRNQERAMQRWVERNGAIRVAQYVERASGGSIEGRPEFQRMLAELAPLRVSVVVVDHLDRWARSVRDGLNVLEQLRGHGVGLVSLGWGRDEPIAIDTDTDWAMVVDEFVGAERERRRIKRRMLRSFEGRRERGATTHNRVPFGIVKVGDHLAPDPEKVWLIHEMEDRLLAGASSMELAYWLHGLGVLSCRTTVIKIARNRAYVEAGVRTLERQAALEAEVARRAQRFGIRVAHEFSGVFRCGFCGRKMPGCGVGQSRADGVGCTGGNRLARDHRHYMVSGKRFAGLWRTLLDSLALGAVESGTRGSSSPQGAKAAAIARRLAGLEQREARIVARRLAALDLLSDPILAVQGKRALVDLAGEEQSLEVERQALTSEAVRVEPVRDAAAIRTLLGRFSDEYEAATAADRNLLNRRLCAAMGSHPVLRRLADRSVTLSWLEVQKHESPPERAIRVERRSPQ